MDNDSLTTQFRLSGGGISNLLMLKTGLIEDGRYHDKRRIAVLIGLTWLPLLILSVLAGDLYTSKIQLPFLMDPGPYARYLIALPILLAAHSIIDPLVAAVINNIQKTGVLPEEGQPQFQAAIHELTRRRDSAWIEALFVALALCLSIALLLGYVDLGLEENASSWAWASKGEGHHPTPAGWWYLVISAPFMQFLLYRWFWRIGIWTAFLYRVSRIRLTLRATHSDLSGGVGILGTGQNAFVVVFLAVAVMTSSSLAQEILFEGRELVDVRMEVLMSILIILFIIEAPLFLFLGQMISAKRKALREYGILHYRLSQDFHVNWIINRGKGMVDSVQPSALADYSAVYETVKNMRMVPIKPRGVVMLAIVILIPFLPLVLTEVSISEFLSRIAGTLL